MQTKNFLPRVKNNIITNQKCISINKLCKYYENSIITVSIYHFNGTGWVDTKSLNFL